MPVLKESEPGHAHPVDLSSHNHGFFGVPAGCPRCFFFVQQVKAKAKRDPPAIKLTYFGIEGAVWNGRPVWEGQKRLEPFTARRAADP